jgi:hypothetical protein
MRTRYVTRLVLALSALAATAFADEPDHLVPLDSAYGSMSPHYDAAVANLLGLGEERVLGAVWDYGGPRTEWAVSLGPSSETDAIVEVREPAESLWETFQNPRHQPPYESVAVNSTSAAIGVSTARAVQRAWTEILKRTRYAPPRQQSCLHCTGVHFFVREGTGVLSGQIQPFSQGPARRLTDVALKLREFVEQPDRRRALEKEIYELADQLARDVAASE